MPPQPLWLLHVPRIIEQLRRLEVPVLATLSVFQRKWRSLAQFQQTRGALAQWISQAAREQFGKARTEPLITLGSAPLGRLSFRGTRGHPEGARAQDHRPRIGAFQRERNALRADHRRVKGRRFAQCSPMPAQPCRRPKLQHNLSLQGQDDLARIRSMSLPV